MKQILIYKDEGADPFGIASLLAALKYEKIDQHYPIAWAQKELFQESSWHDKTALVIFPGGRDSPYHAALKGRGNASIRHFVEKGGNFLGICAGAYYGSAFLEFEQGGPLEVVAGRELKFFPGIARGPAYGLRKFDYRSTKGAQIAKVNLLSHSSELAAYYNGGCTFIDAEKYETVSVLGRYADIKEQPAAIIKCHVGNGRAILSGVHPEYSAYHECTQNHLQEPLFLALKEVEKKRQLLFSILLEEFSF